MTLLLLCLALGATAEHFDSTGAYTLRAPSPQRSSVAVSCQDTRAECSQWSALGYCQHNQYRDSMAALCGRACNSCTQPAKPCYDEDVSCSAWEQHGECTGEYSAYMVTQCRKSCRVCDDSGLTPQGFLASSSFSQTSTAGWPLTKNGNIYYNPFLPDNVDSYCADYAKEKKLDFQNVLTFQELLDKCTQNHLELLTSARSDYEYFPQYPNGGPGVDYWDQVASNEGAPLYNPFLRGKDPYDTYMDPWLHEGPPRVYYNNRFTYGSGESDPTTLDNQITSRTADWNLQFSEGKVWTRFNRPYGAPTETYDFMVGVAGTPPPTPLPDRFGFG